MITAVPLNQETSASKPLLPIMLGVIGGSLVIGGLLASRRKHESPSSHSNGGISTVMLGGLLVVGIAGTIYFVTRNGQSSKAIQKTQARHYINTKEWEISYNDDGMPVKIVKHVRAEIT